MVCYPEVQRKAQAELDKVLDGRLPEHSDLSSLPNLSALVKEVHRCAAVCSEYPFFINYVSRWQPVILLGRSLFLPNIDDNRLTSLSCQGVVHQSTSDDLYNEYHIPANSVVIPNQW